MDWRLVTILLLSCTFFVHSVNGQCRIIEDTTNPLPISENAPSGVPFKIYTLTDDVTSVDGDAPELKFEVDVVSHELKIVPTDKLEKFFDNSGINSEISVLLKLNCAGSSSSPYLRFSVQDTNNRDPEFEPKDFSGTFTLPVYGTPLNWNMSIKVTDLDFVDKHTSMTWTWEGDDILEFAPDYPKRYNHENSNPVRLDYWEIFFRLKPNVNSPGQYTTILKATGVDNPQSFAEFPITLNLLEKEVDTESPVIELNPKISEKFKNEIGHSVTLAQVTDDLDFGVDDLDVAISTEDVDLDGYFESNLILTKTRIGGGSGNLELKLIKEISICKLQNANNLVRLTITVKDKAGRETKTYITLEFEEVELKFTKTHYKFELSEEDQRFQLEQGSDACVQFSIESSDGSEEYLVINSDGTELHSIRKEEDIIKYDGEVDIFLITAKLGNNKEIKIPVVVQNLVPASSSSPPTSTSTTEPETTTTETFPTQTSTPCDCSSCFSSSTPSYTSPVTSIGTTDSSITTDSCPPCITENPICPTTDPSPITDSSSTDPSVTSSTDPSVTSSTDPSVTCAPVTAELCTTIMASTTTESSCVCETTATNPGVTETTDPSNTDHTSFSSSSSTPFPDFTPCPTDVTTTECPLTCPTSPSPGDCSTTTPQDCPVTTCPDPGFSTCTPCPIDCPTTTPQDCPTTTCPTPEFSTCAPCPATGKPDPDPVPTTEETPCPDCSTAGLIAGIAVTATLAAVSSGITAYLVYKLLRQTRSILNDMEPVDYSPSSTKDPEVGVKPTNTQYVSTENLGSSIPYSRPYSNSITAGGDNFVKIDADGGAINTNVSQPSTSLPSNSSDLAPKNIYNSTPAEIKAMYAKEPELQPKYARPISEPDSISRLPSGNPLSEPDPDYKLVTFGDVKVDVIEDVGEEEEEDDEGDEERSTEKDDDEEDLHQNNTNI